MRKKQTWYPYVLVLAVVLLATLTVLVLIEKPRERIQEDILARVAPLEQERDRLMARRDALQQTYVQQKDHPATEHFLFLDLDSQLYTDVYPQLQKMGLTASMGLSADNFPDGFGTISRAQFDELLEAGWDYFLVCSGEESFKAWDREISRQLQEAELEKPKVVCFEKNGFDESMQEEILRCGYEIAVHHGEGGLSLFGKDCGDELWLTGAHPWNYEGVKVDIQELVRFRGDTCFTARFSRGGEVYNRSSFAAMLEYVEPYFRDGTLQVMGFEQARELHSIRIEGMDMTDEQFEQKKAELDEQIRVLNEQIQELYDEWNGGRHD